MQWISTSKLCTAVVLMTVSALSTYPSAGYAGDISHIEHRVENLEKRVSLLETEQVIYGPIAVHNIRLNQAKHFTIVHPGQSINCCFHYKLDSSQQEFLNKNHLIVGLKGVAAEVCATHLYGIWDSSGKANFKLLAPLQEGDYEVRIAYRPGNKCEDALNSWNVLNEEPGSFATIGLIRVINSPIAAL